MDQSKVIDYSAGLTQDLQEIFERVSTLNCIKGLYLCGGTAQSILMNHRLSEDLDFELIGIRRERPELDFNGIINEVQAVFPGAKVDILGDDHFEIFVGEKKSKLSFFRPDSPVKYIHEGVRYNNIVTPSLQDLLGMKLYTICLRTKTRDYYDIYCLLENGCSLKEGISYSSHLSRHNYKSKDMLAKLLSPQLYPLNDEFLKLCPRISCTNEQMKNRFQQAIINELGNTKFIANTRREEARHRLKKYSEAEQKAISRKQDSANTPKWPGSR